MTINSVRGAGTPRAGATDTTMLIWKTIKANPGITRDELLAKIEHGIPEGYALRRYANARQSVAANGSAATLWRARRYVLTDALAHLRHQKSAVRVDGCYSALSPPKYLGNPEAIDVDGSKAAEHMAVADALGTLEKAIARAKPDIPMQSPVRLTHKEYEALVLVTRALRAKGSADQ
jgi:hypothetical protein